MVTPASHLWLRLHGHYRRQHLPLSGGMMEQPNKFIEAMELLSGQFNKIEREQMEEAHRENR
jgi:hypothetical protein